MPTGLRKPGIGGFIPYARSRECSGRTEETRAFIRKRLSQAKSLYRKDLKGHFGCVNAIEFSRQGGEWIASGGDDRRVLLWNVQQALCNKGEPRMMKGVHNSNIFCLAFDHCNSKIFSGGNDEQVVVHDIATGQTLDVFSHTDAVYGLSADPLCESIFASACDDGRVYVYDIRAPPSEDPYILAQQVTPMHAVMYNPAESRLVATANAKEGVSLWDMRKPKRSLLRYGGSSCQQSCMSVRINQAGDRLLALRRRLPPVLYKLNSTLPLYQFDHNGYYNSCTMKSCCFGGEADEYVVSGSDDFNLYMWKIPDESCDAGMVPEAHLVLKGHRSIVNQVRFNQSNQLLISSGVEKVIKVWSPFKMPNCEGHYEADCEVFRERPVYTHEEYLNLVLRSGHVMTHDYSHQSMDEDPRMMAFFDSLVQRELEGGSSDDSSMGSELLERILQASSPSESSEDEANQGNSFMDAVNSLHSSGASQSQSPRSNRMPGQRASSDRRSISSLVAQRKQLNKLKKTEQQRKKRSHCCTSVLLSTLAVSSSDSSDSDIDSSHVGTAIIEGTGRSPSRSLRLRRLKNLRDSVLNSESSDEGLGTSTRTTLTHSPASTSSWSLGQTTTSTPVPMDLSGGAHSSQEPNPFPAECGLDLSRASTVAADVHINGSNSKETVCDLQKNQKSCDDHDGASSSSFIPDTRLPNFSLECNSQPFQKCNDCTANGDTVHNQPSLPQPSCSNGENRNGLDAKMELENGKQKQTDDNTTFHHKQISRKRKRHYRQVNHDASSDED